jgi:hypothetical protein
MSLIADIIGEIFVQIIWDKIIRPIFFFSGVGLRLCLKFKRTPYSEIYKKEDNSVIGFFFWVFAITAFFIIRAKVQ